VRGGFSSSLSPFPHGRIASALVSPEKQSKNLQLNEKNDHFWGVVFQNNSSPPAQKTSTLLLGPSRQKAGRKSQSAMRLADGDDLVFERLA
jgi:hypothetical protein